MAQHWAVGKQGHRVDMDRLSASLADARMIPDGRDVEWAATVLYVVIGLETWHLVRVELDYDPAGYRTWLLDTLRRTFVVDPRSSPSRRKPA